MALRRWEGVFCDRINQIRIKPLPRNNICHTDPVMESFLQFIEKEMIAHPELIEPADADQLRRIGKLVKGVR